MKPFFSYFGSKHRSAPFYPAPKFDTIIEPFAGSAGYSTHISRGRKVILIDKDPIICELWKYLISVSEKEILSLPDIKPDQTIEDFKVGESAKILIGFWLNKACSYPQKKPSSWMIKDINKKYQYWGYEKRLLIASQLKNIRHWEIKQGDYFDVQKTPVTWFIDPPYVDKGKYYKCGSKSIDFNKLEKWCKSLPGQGIVCEQFGAEWLPFRPFKTVKSTMHNYSSELIWTKNCMFQPALMEVEQ